MSSSKARTLLSRVSCCSCSEENCWAAVVMACESLSVSVKARFTPSPAKGVMLGFGLVEWVRRGVVWDLQVSGVSD